ncbi:hypothetical protein HPB47_020968 [Ixodes persulcatus]|uniref:Placenta growth factor, putative n=3 Tax=Ixodes TaxID=6944 RepID=B7PDA7_IXOSC|nr:snake venom vascular endothelial growth factor toxin [Ixodes scapularis]EEC04579.1 placenta growth factor, putative [Ixodes scapularis]KAG0432301.1 hypothetical protein HPB47_020968 [Ixodes persulcatus]|eukprot:XP_002410706.1 placenta growth factor, putative [Ixodes scapularis]
MALTREHVATRLLCTALLVLWTCFAVGLCRPQKRYGSRQFLRASQHLELVQQQGRCKFPQPRTLCVPDIYPNESKRYAPHCTILHRCAADTGCCSSTDEHCQPKSVQAVERAFLVLELDISGEQHTKVETLVFENHTECECRPKYDHIR